MSEGPPPKVTIEQAEELIERFREAQPDYRRMEERIAALMLATGDEHPDFVPRVRLKLLREFLPKHLLDTETARRRELRQRAKHISFVR